ncbi:hypothetical protein FGW37_05280 [Streptomyces rectiverticillatus]|nr:hypothetical protein FGW37_05280 [Streptomyces rectiverticillatus]
MSYASSTSVTALAGTAMRGSSLGASPRGSSSPTTEAGMEPNEKPNIAEVIHHYYSDWDCRRTGGWESVRCPFHGDSSPSATVNTDLSYFKCFACDAAGDSFWVIMEEESCDFPTALEVADRLFDFRSEGVSRPGGGVRGSRRVPFDTERPLVGHQSILSTRRRGGAPTGTRKIRRTPRDSLH